MGCVLRRPTSFLQSWQSELVSFLLQKPLWDQTGPPLPLGRPGRAPSPPGWKAPCPSPDTHTLDRSIWGSFSVLQVRFSGPCPDSVEKTPSGQTSTARSTQHTTHIHTVKFPEPNRTGRADEDREGRETVKVLRLPCGWDLLTKRDGINED